MLRPWKLTSLTCGDFISGIPIREGGMLSANENDALVREFLSAWERRDSEFIIEHFTDDATYHAMPLRPITGKSELTAWVKSFEDNPPGKLDIKQQVANENLVMNERVDSIQIEGKDVKLAICAVFLIDGARIRAWREYFDLAGLQTQLRTPNEPA
jgi:limonene-1,2-epoxide hydrolase